MRQEPIRYKIIILFTLLIGILLFQSVFFPSGVLTKQNYMQEGKENLKGSDFWVLTYTIHIDDNWSATVAMYDWCTGSGTWEDPYLIENVMIDAQYSGSCIFIENTDEYFIIHNCTVINGQATGGQAGIRLYYVSNGTITQNIVTENYAGMYLDHIENITIIENDVIDNPGQGIVLFHSSKNFIINNNQTGSHYYGLFINSGSNNNTVIGNTFQKNTGAATFGEGIRILNSQFNNIINNNLLDNDKGIRIEDNSNYNMILQNVIENNFDYGAFVIANSRDSLGNFFYHNTFNNTAYNAYDNGTGTLWDNGVIGNFWSDYGGVDANNDGIGDTPYPVDGEAGSMDNYPIVDNTAPIININNPISENIFNSPPNYDIVITEDHLDTVWYTMDDGLTNFKIIANNGMIDASTWNALSDGIITIKFYANDTIANLGSAEVTISKDTTAPVIAINEPIDGQMFGSSPPNYNISITENNLDSMWYTMDGGVNNFTLSTYTGLLDSAAWSALSDGSITITFYANDTAGNRASINITITRDTTPSTPPAIPFGSSYLIIAIISITSLVISIKVKQEKVIKK